MKKPLLKVNKLHISFHTVDRHLQVVRGFDMELAKGEIVGILGESGSGKTVSASAILGLISAEEGGIDQGEIIFHDKNLGLMNEKELKLIRGKKIAFVFQNPSASLNPYKKIGKQIKNLLKLHNISYNKTTIIKALEEVGLEDPLSIYHMYPSQLSGGQNQRIMIAQCVLLKPELLIADEPTSSIDASLQKKVLDLLKSISEKYGMSLIMITHDFDAAKYICHRLYVMYGGLMVEEGGTENLLHAPKHPYTRELIRCAQSLSRYDKVLYSLEGAPPSPPEFTDTCPFYNRCTNHTKECLEEIPVLRELNEAQIRCLHPLNHLDERRNHG